MDWHGSPTGTRPLCRVLNLFSMGLPLSQVCPLTRATTLAGNATDIRSAEIPELGPITGPISRFDRRLNY